MKKRLLLLTFVSLSYLLVSAQFKIITYQSYWTTTTALQYSKLTHVNFAFALPTSTGALKPLSGGSMLSTIVTNMHALGGKVYIAVGGYSDGGTLLGPIFASAASNTTNRTKLVTDIMTLVNTYNLDGVDIDWEFPSNTTESNNFTLLMQQLNSALNPLGKGLSAAVSAGSYYGQWIPSASFPYLSHLNVMAYDDDQQANHSTYSFAQSAINYYVGRGCPANKVILGVPFYARPSWTAYIDLLAAGASPNSDQFGSDYYNGIPTIKSKTDLAYNTAGGIMIWEMAQDAIGTNSLLSAIYAQYLTHSCSAPQPDLGADQSICGVSSITLNSGVATASGRTFTWKKNSTIVVNASTTATTYAATTAGTYDVVVTEGACSKTDQMIISGTLSTPVLGGPYDLCNPTSVTLDAGVTGTGVSYQWQKNAVNISGATAKTYTASTAGTFKVIASATGCTSTNGSATVTSSLPTGTNDTLCAAGTANLNASASVDWYAAQTGGTKLITGTTYAPSVSATTSYWIQAGSTAVSNTTMRTAFQNDGWQQDGNVYGTKFDVLQALTMDQITINAGGGAVTVNVVASNGVTIVATKSFGTLAAGLQILTLNFSLPIGSYFINTVGSTSTTLVDLTPATNYTVTNVVTVYGEGYWDWSAPYGDGYVLSGDYGCFINMKVTTGSSCGRVPVTAVIDAGNAKCTSSPPVANFTFTPTTGCTAQTVTFTDATTGTVTGYAWNFGTGATPATATTKGPHNVTYSSTGTKSVSLIATNTFGNNTKNQSVTITTIPSAAGSITGTATLCANTSTTYTVGAVSGATTYTWTVPTGASITAGQGTTSITVTMGTISGNVGVTPSNACGNGTAASLAITINSTTANAGLDQAICSGKSASLTATGGGTYAWNTGATTAAISVTPASNTTYTVTVTNSGCTNSDAIIVTVNTTPVANAGVDKSICNGTSTSLTATGGGTYQWNSGANTAINTVSPLSTTTYTVTVTSGSCSASDAAIIIVNTAPTANAGADNAICKGTSTTLSGQGGTTYTWNTGATTANITVTPTINTTYTLTATIGSCSNSDAIIVTVNTVPTANAGVDQTICSGNSSSLTATGGTSYLWSNGGNTSTTSVSPTVTTTYTVTASNGLCTSTDMAIVTVNALPIALITGAENVVCAGTTITLVASGGSSYKWNTNKNTASINITPSATITYTVTVTASNSCTAMDEAIVTVQSGVTANAGTDQTVCKGNSASLNASGGTTYAWNTGATTAGITVTPTATTTYTVTASIIGCSASDAVIVNVNTNTAANAGVDQTICTGNSASLLASGEVSYSWNTGATTAGISVTPSATTTYTVTATDINGCTGSDVVIVNVNTSLVANAGVDQTICNGSSATLLATGGTSYSWSSGASTASTTVSPVSTTTYTVTVSSAGCGTASDAVVVTVNTSLVANAGIDQTICKGITTSLTATGGATYAWNTGATTAIINITPAISTTYTVTATSGSCTASDNVIVNVNALPTANAGLDKTICNGTSTSLTASGGTSYLWNTGAATASITISPAVTSSYTVTAYNGSCSANDFAVVTVNSNPQPNLGNDQTVCENATVSLNANAIGSFLWSTGATTQTIAVSPVTTSTYSVTVTANSCTGTDNIIVTIQLAPTVNAGLDAAVCEGSSSTINATSNGTSFIWNTSETTQNISVSPVTTSTYTITATLNGCTNSDAIIISINALPTANADIDKTICSGNSTGLTGTGGITYAWSTGAATATITVSPLVTTTYTLTVTNASGCTATDNVIVSVLTAAVTADAGIDQTICNGITTTVSAASNGTLFTWNNGATTQSISVTPAVTTTYTVTASSSDGCATASDAIVININAVPIANAGTDKNICRGDATTLTATGTGTYEWSNGTTAATTTISPIMTSTFSVTVTNNGCSSSDAVVVNVNTLPIAFAGNDVVACTGATVALTATGGVSYVWNTSATTASISVTPLVTTTYTVTITNASGCTASDAVIVTVSSSTISANAGFDKTICSGQSASITASGGDTYAWSNSATTAITAVTPLTTTTYTVTAYSASGCAPGTDMVIVNVISLPIANAGNDQTICSGESSFLNSTGGDAYLWNTGDASAYITIAPLTTTTFTVTVSANGCSASDNVIINVNASPVANAGIDQTICASASATLNASGGGTYAWSNGVVIAATTVSPLITTTYTVTVTSNACTAIDEMIVNVSTLTVTANAGNDVAICSGNSTILTATGGDLYAWSTGATTPSISVTPSITSTYIVTVTKVGACAPVSDNVVVTVNANPTANAGIDQTTCAGYNVSITATGGTDYLWSTGASTASTIVTPANNTIYTVTVTTNGCTASDAMQITTNTSPATNAGADANICFGQLATLRSGNNGVTYAWSTGGTSKSISVSPAITTTYTLTVTKSGCSAKDEAVVFMNTPVANAGLDKTVCAGLASTLTATGIGTYGWNTGATTANITINPVINTTYTVTVTNLTCTASDAIAVAVNTFTPSTGITGKSNVLCDATIESYSITNNVGSTYAWTVPFSLPITGNGTNVISIDYTMQSGIDIVQVIETNALCNVVDTLQVSVIVCSTDILTTDNSSSTLKVYPNPVSNELNFNLTSPLTQEYNMQIQDVRGVTLMTKTINSNTSYKINQNWAAGIYFIRINNNEENISFKVLKVK